MIDEATVKIRHGILSIVEEKEIGKHHCVLCLSGDRGLKLRMLSLGMNIIIH